MGTHHFRTFPNIFREPPPRGRGEEGHSPVPNISEHSRGTTTQGGWGPTNSEHFPNISEHLPNILQEPQTRGELGEGAPPVPNFFRTFPAHFRVEPPRV